MSCRVEGTVGKVKGRGPADIVSAATNRAVEAWLGVRTGESIDLEDAGAAARNRVWHAASDWIPIRRSLAALRVGPSDVFLDYGSGLGRGLVVARGLPFSRVIGVEVSQQLAARARTNLERQAHGVRCRQAEVVVADAALWEVPDDVTVVYMYCPFTGPIFASATRRLLASVDRCGRRVRLVYNNPFEHNFLLQTGRFRPTDVISAIWPGRGVSAGRVIVTYDVLADPVQDPTGDRARLGPWGGFNDNTFSLKGDFESALEASEPG
jgi:hypothetical protein